MQKLQSILLPHLLFKAMQFAANATTPDNFTPLPAIQGCASCCQCNNSSQFYSLTCYSRLCYLLPMQQLSILLPRLLFKAVLYAANATTPVSFIPLPILSKAVLIKFVDFSIKAK